MKTSTTIFLIFLSFYCAAQSNRFGVKFGIGPSKVSSFVYNKNATSFSAGITYERILTKNISAQGELLFCKAIGKSVIFSDSLGRAINKSNFTNCLMLPILIKVKTNPGTVMPFVNAGIAPSIITANLFYVAGGGFDIKFSKTILSIEGRYSLGAIQKTSTLQTMFGLNF